MLIVLSLPLLLIIYKLGLIKVLQLELSLYRNTFYTLDTDSDIGVKIGSSVVATQMSNKNKNTHNY